MSEPLTFKAQLSPLQSALQHGPDGMLVKLIPQGMNAEMAAEFYGLQECALTLTVKDVMGDFKVNASIPDTASAIRINKTSPQVTFHIPRGDVLTGLRLVALFGVVFTVEVEGGAVKEKPKRTKKPPKPHGEYGRYWEAMVKATVFNRPDLWTVLGVDNSADAPVALRSVFNVTSRTFISPADFERWCDKNGLESLVTVSRFAAAEVEA